MNDKVHPLVAALVIVLAVLAFGVWTWAGGEAKRFGGPAGLLAGPDGHLYVQMQHYLLEHDADGRFLERHDLAALGAETVIGAVVFFPDGDLLLRRGPDDRGVLDHLRAFLRLRNEDSIDAASPESGLARCDLESGECAPFATPAVDFNAAFGVAIDPRTEAVYFSDTTRHALLKFAADGTRLARSEDGFRFPNQLLLHDGRLYVANTNGHDVRVVDPATERFGQAIDSLGVVPAEARAAGQTWPSRLARVGDAWWVDDMRSNMADGGIYVFDGEWNYRRRVDLPAGADPVAILPFGDEVLVADWNHDRVYRVAKDGRVAGDFVSTGLDALVAESSAERRRYRAYSWLGFAALAPVLIALVFRALRDGSRPPERAEPIERAANEIEWFRPNPKVLRRLLRVVRLGTVAAALLVVLVVAAAAACGDVATGATLAVPLVGICAAFVAVTRAQRSNAETAIGLAGDAVTLVDHEGRETTLPMHQVIYNEFAVAGRDTAVFLGQPQYPIYDREQVKERLLPGLAGATRVSPWQMQKALWRVRHPQARGAMYVLVGLALVAAWLLVARLLTGGIIP